MTFLQDNRQAAELFGFTGLQLNEYTPRHKFQFFVNFRFNGAANGFVGSFLGREAQDQVAALVKTVQLPGLSVNTEVLNQYNRKKVIQTRIEPQTVSITFHDVVNGKSLKMWEMYYEYYFRDGVGKGGGGGVNMAQFPHDTVRPRFVDEFGYNLENVQDDRQLLNAVEIYQSQAEKITATTLVAPTITSFTHDLLDYSDGQSLMELRMDFLPEAIVYDNESGGRTSGAAEILARRGIGAPQDSGIVAQAQRSQFLSAALGDGLSTATQTALGIDNRAPGGAGGADGTVSSASVFGSLSSTFPSNVNSATAPATPVGSRPANATLDAASAAVGVSPLDG